MQTHENSDHQYEGLSLIRISLQAKQENPAK
jgi:hypothetical protein